jgi:DNA repair exonuclease SbcCD ATPase subunit
MEIMKNRIEGLTARLEQLKKEEQLFLQASGLEKQAAKARKQGEEMTERFEKTRDAIQSMSAMQSEMTGQALAGFLNRMDEALPEGNAYIRIADKPGVAIGWTIGGIERPLQALSGGERVAFDTALAHALGAGILIKEVAELDNARLELTMARLQVLEPQVILVTCHPEGVNITGWTVVATK